MSLLERLFNRDLSSGSAHSVNKQGRKNRQPNNDGYIRPTFEQLEQKIALAAQAFSEPQTGGLDGGRHVIVLDANNDDLYIRVTQQTSDIGEGPDIIEQIQFDTNPNFSAPQGLEHENTEYQDLFVTAGLANSYSDDDVAVVGNADGFVAFELPTALESSLTPTATASSLSAVVPGTMHGVMVIRDARTPDTVEFTTKSLRDGTGDNLVFRVNDNGSGAWSNVASVTHTVRKIADNGDVTLEDRNLTIEGRLDSSSGQIVLDFDGNNQTNYPLEGRVSLGVNYASPIIPEGPSTVRLSPGLNLDTGFMVDLPGEDSTIEIASPILQAGTPNTIALGATQISVDAVIDSNDGFFVSGTTGSASGLQVQNGIGGDWYGGGGGDTEVEQVVLSAPVTAPEFGFVIKDDQQTSSRSRGMLHVTSTGALNGTSQLAVEATHSDIIFEGSVAADVQSYLFRTRTETQPFQFITNQAPGLPTGVISGGTVDITLANDDSISATESITHNVKISTNVDSLRITAAGDDSYGFNSTGVVGSVVNAAGNIVVLNDATGVEVGDIIYGNTADGIVPRPLLEDVSPDDQLNQDGAGTIFVSSPVSLAEGSTVRTETQRVFEGFPVALNDVTSMAVGQILEDDLGNQLGLITDLIRTPAISPESGVVVLDTAVDPLVPLNALDVVYSRISKTVIAPLDATASEYFINNTNGIVDNMFVTGTNPGQTARVTAVGVGTVTLENNAIGSGNIGDTLNFYAPTYATEDRSQLQATVDQVEGVAAGAFVSVGSQVVADAVGLPTIQLATDIYSGLLVGETVLINGDSANPLEVVGIVGDELTVDLPVTVAVGDTVDFVNLSEVTEFDQSTRTITLTDELTIPTTTDFILRSPNLVVTETVSQGTVVRTDSLIGVGSGSTLLIPQADIPSGTVVAEVNGNTLTLSQTITGNAEAGSSVAFGRLQENEYFRYDIDIAEQDELDLDATVASGGPVSVTAGGDLAVDASLRSHGDVLLVSSGAVTGNAWLVTREGELTVQGASVTLNGDAQVLASPFDESITDVTLSSTNGSVLFTGSVNAVNRVLVEQSGTGEVNVQGVAVASDVEVYSDGSVTLATDANNISIVAEGLVGVSERNNASFDVQTPGRISLVANGVDPESQAALRATIRESTNLVLSAPSGSIDVSALSPSTMTIGESELLLAGISTDMQAAGNVSIRSGQEEVIVLDAPIAGDGRLQVRAVSTEDLDGTYLVNNPGVAPTTLTGGNENINSFLATNSAVVPGFGGNSLSLRVRDTVLLTNQDAVYENGLYQITSLGSTSSPWSMRRLAFADTTAELPTNSRIRIQDGPSSDSVYIVGAYINDENETPLSVTEGNNRNAEEITVDYAAESALDGIFAAGVITGNSPGLVINGAGVKDGELVLVRQGVVNETVIDPETGNPLPDWSNEHSWPSNGVYVKSTNAGNWQLDRFQLPTTGAVVQEATVVVSQGLYRTAATGQTFSVAYDGLGLADVPITIDSVSTEIGSYDPRDTTTFVVTTAGATNNAAGSLGKMLSLVRDNDAKDLTNESLEQSIQFANVLGSPSGSTGTILLQQELPLIERAFSLDTTSRFTLQQDAFETIVIDGSRITATRGGTFVTSSTEVNGLEYKAGSGTNLEPVPGTVIPEEPTIGELRGVRLVGFDQGGAVVIDGASNLLLDSVTVGLDANNEPRSSLYGIRVTGDSGETGPVTLLSTDVFASNILTGNPSNPLDGAGVQINGSAQGVQIVDSTIGSVTGSNTVGVVVESDNDNLTRPHSIGINPIPTDYLIELNTVANKATLAIPADMWSVIGEDLHLGQSVSATGIATGSEIIYINPATREVVLSDRMTDSGLASVTFSAPGRATITENFFGVDLRSGSSRMVNTTVSDNVVSGIRVGVDVNNGDVQQALWAQIGAGIALDDSGVPSSAVRSTASNEIYGNGRYGIQFRSGITGMTISNGVTTEITIQGNYIGTNTSAASGLQNGRFDYWWDANGAGSNEPPVDPVTSQVDPSFTDLITSADPLGDTPAEDNSGNISADVGGEDGVSGGGSGSGGTGGNDGIVTTPIRR